MRPELRLAECCEAAAIAALRVLAAEDLTNRFGLGHWSGNTTERGVLFAMRIAKVYVLQAQHKIIATLTLSTRKPWAIDRKYFSACKRPFYLTAMAVMPTLQRRGIGRQCIEAAIEKVKQESGDAIFLDAYDAVAGAGAFYRKCGFREVGRVSYRSVPLVYYEMLIENPLSPAGIACGPRGKPRTPR